MKLTELSDKSILILGLGVEGLSTFNFLRGLFPDKVFGIADRGTLEALESECRKAIEDHKKVDLHLGASYLDCFADYDVIIKTPGMSVVKHPQIQEAFDGGKLTSHTELFFNNCPGRIVGVTGTKGKGTTSKLIYEMLRAGGVEAHLVGNIGNPPLPLLTRATDSTIFVFEMSAQQLELNRRSPNIAVLLNVVPDHLDHFVTFETYRRAKSNIARFQTSNDWLVFNAAFPIPSEIACRSRSHLVPYSVEESLSDGISIDAGRICCRIDGVADDGEIFTDTVIESIPGAFNLHNVLPAIAVARILGAQSKQIVDAIRSFEPQEHRFECVGTHRGITFYNASIATVPEVTIEHMNALGERVQTLLLGGHERGVDFTKLADKILASDVKNVILFPETGKRIWGTIEARQAVDSFRSLPHAFLIDRTGAEAAMREAVRLAYLHTDQGRICLHSPASPSFGIFKNYKERGELFKKLVREGGQSEVPSEPSS
jgi:UDP-N-acetylmuramoylalanine--D-glutamate ligase